METVDVGRISNYYGGLNIKQDGDKFYWSIENYDGDEWKEISKSLYNELLHHDRAYNAAQKQLASDN